MDTSPDIHMNSSTNMPAEMWPVHIEVRVTRKATARFDTIRNAVYSYIQSSLERIYLPSTLQGWQDVPLLASSVDRIVASESSCPSASLPLTQTMLQIHVYQPSDSDAFEELASGSGRGDGEEVMAASVCELPSLGWEGLWDSLIYADDIKSRLLDYIYATVVFSDANVDFNVVSWNRVVLLHGPPGTGKTSLCRALAQKLSIRLSHRYPHARLLEINSHSLFSRWFSESGKLVQRLFSSVIEMVDDEETFVVILIDEVESLTAARAGAMAGTEPSDALRVVNALLTQLDKLKHRKNVLVLSTSNLAKAIDSAFVDRADIVQYVDLPSREAIYEILRTCLSELIKKGIVADGDVPTLSKAMRYKLTAPATQATMPPPSTPILQVTQAHDNAFRSQDSSSADASTSQVCANGSREVDPLLRSRQVAIRLLGLADKCREQGMSGRSLRRLPVLAHARYIGVSPMVAPELFVSVNGTGTSNPAAQTAGSEVEIWLKAMERVVEGQAVEREKLEKS